MIGTLVKNLSRSLSGVERACFSFSLLFLVPVSLYSQSNLEVGQSIKLSPCPKGKTEFISMDVYARTKPYDTTKVNKATGDGLLKEFFSDKSIDAKRLPCSMGGYSYKIAALHDLSTEKEPRRVVLLYTKFPLTLIWMELDKAIENRELLLK